MICTVEERGLREPGLERAIALAGPSTRTVPLQHSTA